MSYDLTKVSDAEAQIVGDVLAKAALRIRHKIKRAEDTLEYQESHGSGLNGLFVLTPADWDEAAAETRGRLQYLRDRLVNVEAILKVITI